MRISLYISFSYLYHSNDDISSNIDELLFDNHSLEEVFIKQNYTEKELLALYDKIAPAIIVDNNLAEEELAVLAPNNEAIEEDIVTEELAF